MQRVRLTDLRQSRLPRVLGLCQGDIPEICQYANAAQSRLIHAAEAGNEGWYGCYSEIAFSLTRTTPYVTLPREIARLENATVCDKPIAVNNEFIQYLQFGNGRLRKERRCGGSPIIQGVSRNNAVTFRDMTNAPQYIRVYLSDDRDVAKRVLIQGTDANGNTIYSTDNLVEVTGVFLALDSPFVTSPMTFGATPTGIQKDQTYGKVEFYQVDPTSGEEILLLTMEPGETTASYRRYFFNALPCSCCPTQDEEGTVQVTAIAKMELLPLVVDTDYTVLTGIGAIEAIIHEAQAVKYAESDSPSAKGMAADSHRQAIRLLAGQLSHYNSIENVAVNFAPFGSANLERISIGMI